MIDLRIGQFRLAYDSASWTVSRITTVQKEGPTFGQERETEHGYHHRLSHALQDVFDRLAGSEDAHTIEALLSALQTHARSITEAAAEVDRQLLTLRHGKG